ncbi:MAG: flagellar biosynthesis anti-sigma factor FlgM [Desulfatiglandaceae bacterium]
MKIFGDNRLANLDAYLKGIRDKNRADASSSKGSGDAGSTDKVELSPEAKQIQKAKKLVDALPDIRKEKVEEIKSRIKAGAYEVDSEKVASKMMEESLIHDMS